MNIRIPLFLLLFISYASAKAQQPATTDENIHEAVEKRQRLTEHSLVMNVPFKNIGPSIMSGRVTDIAVNPENPTEFYVGYASGGVWHTANNGTSFTPILDNAPTQNVGSLAVDWKNGTIWVGTGENNASRSSYPGIGLLKSTDRGATWTNTGLEDVHHFGPISINPYNPNEVLVAAVGHLYSPNRQRGVYKTTNGGETWSKKLYVGDQTGIIDLVRASNAPQVIFAAAWQKDRKAWNFDGSGKYSGIYKSNDNGDTWELISTEESGFPTGPGIGRIGLAAFDNNIIYAVLDNQNHRKPTEGEAQKQTGLTKDQFNDITMDAFLDLDDKTLNAFLRKNNFDQQYDSERIKEMVKAEEIEPRDLAKYLTDANSELFDTPVIGAEIYRSTNSGATWEKMNETYLDDVFYSYGYYFSWIRVDPSDKNKLYTGGVPIIKSADAGRTWEAITAENVHSDHHSLWIDPKLPGHLINGNDGGVNITYDDGKTWTKNNSEAVGQFYDIAVDYQTPYNVYGGLQDNGVWMGPHDVELDRSWEQEGDYPWKRIMGGDGMQVQIDRRNPDLVYTGFQYGNYFRIDLASGERTYIQPKHKLGESPYRFNWESPILLSTHNQDIVYLGGNKLMRSLNQGDDWEPISPDLTKGGREGNVAYGTLTTISESPFQFGLLYTGSDDGLVQYSADGGNTWELRSNTLPQDLWVSSLEASKHKKERVYLALNGYRWDDFTPYVYKSDDYGETWASISSNLPLSPINVIKEDPVNENILYLGTDNSAYISFDGGADWQLFSKDIPAVAIHDMEIQEEEKHLLVGTHGRSIYLADAQPFQMLKDSTSLQVFSPREVNFSSRWGSKRSWQTRLEPNLELAFFSPADGVVSITIVSEKGNDLKSWDVSARKGFNYPKYNLSLSKGGVNRLERDRENLSIEQADNGNYYLPDGTYTVRISKNDKSAKTTLKISKDGSSNNAAPTAEAEGEG